MNVLKYYLKYTTKCTFFVLLVLALIQPFGIDRLEKGRVFFILCETGIAFVATYVATMIAHYCFTPPKLQEQTLGIFLKISALNYFINILAIGAALLTFNSWYHTGDASAYWFHEGHFTLKPLGIMIMYVAALSFFLFIIQCFDYRNKRLKNELDEVKAINLLLEQRQQKLEEEEEKVEAAASEQNSAQPTQLVTIEGQGIDATLHLDPANIIYVESMANYADICYIADNETRHTTLRITLKNIRASLESIDYIVQCHRAFLVNINFVVSLSNRSQGYQLQLFGMEKQIPVSRSNTEAIKAKLS